MRVALLVTGKTELRGLPGALQDVFPGIEFQAIEDVPGRPFRGFTSNPVPAPIQIAPTSLDKLVARAISLVEPADAKQWDLVVIFEDLELANRSQPDRVCEAVRQAFANHVAGLERDEVAKQTLAEAIRHRISFHLAVPMIESWFFAAPSALTALGLGATSFHKKPGDPEQFESTDKKYIGAVPSSCTAFCRNGSPKGDRPKWIGAQSERVLHPKGYIQWLLMDPAHKTCTSYRESTAGQVLEKIEWARLLGNPDHMPFARALIADLAEGLGQSPAIPAWDGFRAGVTSRTEPDGQRSFVLRNL